ncbi:MAG: asparagine synthase (glutamine-hydrolyzing) [Pseudomonadota bacterium]
MCGVAGVLWRPGAWARREAEHTVKAMADTLIHRGPDSAGTWTDVEAGIALGHRRLAIVDLSAAGHQPLGSASGRFMLSYNGEIYNHRDLRDALQASDAAPDWRGASDTETLAAAFDAWGIDETLARATGMFAIAVWDRETRTLSLARDRFGEKPLYYGWQGSGREAAFLFGSELRALRRHPSFAGEIARSELPHFARHGYMRTGRSIYTGIAQVQPGEIVCVGSDAGIVERRFYWNAAAEAQAVRADAPFTGTEAEAIACLERRLERAVVRQMMADVPLGAFLSGGIDSSVVVALMQRNALRPVHTYAIGFHEGRYNEAERAKAVAAHLGTHHTELYVGPGELLDVVPNLTDMYDEPFADSSQIPTHIVSSLARQSVTVALSGDGGDELFGGYDRYRKGAHFFRAMALVPLGLRRGAAACVAAMPPRVLKTLLRPVRKAELGKEPNGQWAQRLAVYAASDGIDSFHRALSSHTQRAAALLPRAAPDPLGIGANGAGLTPAERMMQRDLVGYLPGYILTKVDRASMAVSLETRAPFLDPAVARFAFSLPEAMKIRGHSSKWLLRELCYRVLPRTLVDRPKMGFEVPTGVWLRGPLREWAGDLLSPDRVRRQGWFETREVQRMWDEHQSNAFDHGLGLWHILMFQAWLARWHD